MLQTNPSRNQFGYWAAQTTIMCNHKFRVTCEEAAARWAALLCYLPAFINVCAKFVVVAASILKLQTQQ